MHKYLLTKIIFLIIFLTVLGSLSTITSAKSVVEEKTQSQLPPACRTDCATSYGEVLGIADGDVIAYSNCRAKCVIFDPHYKNGTYTGIKWQCVEFARRWLLTHKGVVYGDVNIATDIWNQIDFVTRVADGKQFQLKSHLNGSTKPPQIGDLLIYAKAFFNTGHVAVVTGVDLKADVIWVAEQNFSNQKWVENYARKIDLIEKGGKYWLLEAYLLGWKQVLLSTTLGHF
jgi:hypothetical protein